MGRVPGRGEVGLAALLAAFARGETDAQHELLEEVEPLLFGYARSLAPTAPGAHERAVADTHALTLAFFLRASRGHLDWTRIADMRAWAHRAVARRRRDENPVVLADGLADPDTLSLVDACFGLGLRLQEAMDGDALDELADRLLGAAPTARWPAIRRAAASAGVLPRTGQDGEG